MRIAIGTDHRGRDAAENLRDRLVRDGHEARLFGDTEADSVDYPDSAYLVGRSVGEGESELGVLICGTGIGMSIAANKLPGIRAAVVSDELTAELSRSHNDANVLCVSSDLLGRRKIDMIVDKFLMTEFEGGRHERRVNKIRAIESGRDPATEDAPA
ncbi:MAG: ribose 5-phosphate isomerase B [Planctomycetota bacterium]